MEFYWFYTLLLNKVEQERRISLEKLANLIRLIRYEFLFIFQRKREGSASDDGAVSDGDNGPSNRK